MSKAGYLFLLPSLLVVGGLLLYPLADTLYLSLTTWIGLANVAPAYVGSANFRALFADPEMGISIWHNIEYMALGTLGTVSIGLLLAALLDMRLHGWSFFRGIFYLSVMMPAIVTGRLFVSLYSPYIGLINPVMGFFYALVGLSAPAPQWLSDPSLVMFAIIMKDVWQYAGFPMLLFVAGFSTIPDYLYEAAVVEGASEWQIFWRVKLPMIRNIFAIVVALQLLFSFKVFDTIWTMTEGGPGDVSQVLSTYLFKEAFQAQSFGYASAIAVIMLAIIFPIALVYLRLSKFGESA